MRATAKEAWKLHTVNQNVRPAIPGYDTYDSEEDASSAACDRLKLAHVKIICIEGPNGERTEKGEIERLCGSSTLAQT